MSCSGKVPFDQSTQSGRYLRVSCIVVVIEPASFSASLCGSRSASGHASCERAWPSHRSRPRHPRVMSYSARIPSAARQRTVAAPIAPHSSHVVPSSTKFGHLVLHACMQLCHGSCDARFLSRFSAVDTRNLPLIAAAYTLIIRESRGRQSASLKCTQSNRLANSQPLQPFPTR